jgi:DNA-binding CsgD family transcriptional regulator
MENPTEPGYVPWRRNSDSMPFPAECDRLGRCIAAVQDAIDLWYDAARDYDAASRRHDAAQIVWREEKTEADMQRRGAELIAHKRALARVLVSAQDAIPGVAKFIAHILGDSGNRWTTELKQALSNMLGMVKGAGLSAALADRSEWIAAVEVLREKRAFLANADYSGFVEAANPVAIATVDPSHRLVATLDRFYVALEATTTAAANGHEIGPAPHAITLSQATDALHEAMGAAMPSALARDDQTLLAALVSAAQATGWPADRHNRAQAGGWPHRWEPGELISADVLAAIDQARKLLAVYPLRSGYDKPAPAEAVDAVRKVIADWDGKNWAAVRAAMMNDGKSRADIEAMTMDDVRQYFAVGQKRILRLLGGQPFTATNTVIADGLPAAIIETARPANGGPARARRRRRATPDAKPLTDRERQAVNLADQGHGPTAIGQVMGIAKSTAATLRDNGREKLKAIQMAVHASGNSVRPKAGIADVQFSNDAD